MNQKQLVKVVKRQFKGAEVVDNKFEDAEMYDGCPNPVGFKVVFPNLYGASVVSHRMSYGGHKGEKEVAEFFNLKGGEMYLYELDSCGGVDGYLSSREVLEKMEELAGR